MSELLSERQVLNQLGIPDFRHLKKDKVIAFVSMLNRMDPEVAKKAIEQCPEFFHMTLGALQEYEKVIVKTNEYNAASNKQCIDLLNEIVVVLKNCIDKPDLSFEERQYYIDKMIDVAQMAKEKDSENKAFLSENISKFAMVALFALGITATALGGNLKIGVPNIRRIIK